MAASPQVWSFDLGDVPKLVFERSLQESITSVECGVVTTNNYEEVVVCSYAGKLLSFSSEPSTGDAAETGVVGETAKEKNERKMRNLVGEIDRLRVQAIRRDPPGSIEIRRDARRHNNRWRVSARSIRRSPNR